MTDGQRTQKPRPRTFTEAWPFGVLAIVVFVVLMSLTALGPLAFNAWQQNDWDSMAVLSLSAATVAAIPVPTFLVLKQLTRTTDTDNNHRSNAQ